MPVLNEIGGLEQVIDTFDFRNKGAIKIPKSKRSKAYIQAVDVIVNTIDFNLYENNKAIPNLQFYGYATLVFEDCLTLEVPLRFPRMRIYQQRNEMALSQWRRIEEYYSSSYQWFTFFFGLVAAGQDPPLDPPPAQMPMTRFIELPLREVYVNVQDNCQFQIEYSQWQPIGFTAPDGRNFNGSSGQTDGDKDGGLPDGIQPRRNPANEPFKGNIPVSTSIQLGEFKNDKLDNLNDVDDGNLEQPVLWEFTFSFVFLNNSGTAVSISCANGQKIRVTGLTSDSITVRYGTVVLGVATNGEKFYGCSLEWKGATVFTFGAGIRNASVLECSRVIV